MQIRDPRIVGFAFEFDSSGAREFGSSRTSVQRAVERSGHAARHEHSGHDMVERDDRVDGDDLVRRLTEDPGRKNGVVATSCCRCTTIASPRFGFGSSGGNNCGKSRHSTLRFGRRASRFRTPGRSVAAHRPSLVPFDTASSCRRRSCSQPFRGLRGDQDPCPSRRFVCPVRRDP